jgi:hypothetical protein
MAYEKVDAAISFYETYEKDGLATDGLPQFKSQVRIRKIKPGLDVNYEATEDDFEQFTEEYALFQKHRQARETTEGYPLVMWPAVGATEQQMLAAREIFTVEQLAKLADRRGDSVLPQIRELAKRAKQMVTLQKETGQFEAIINDLTQQRDALVDQLREANATIASQNAQLGRQMQAA